MSKEKRSTGIRALNALCALVFLGAVVYVLVAGYQMMAIGTMALALAVVAGPVIAGGEGILDALLGIVEAFFDGLLAIVEGITDFLSSIFS